MTVNNSLLNKVYSVISNSASIIAIALKLPFISAYSGGKVEITSELCLLFQISFSYNKNREMTDVIESDKWRNSWNYLKRSNPFVTVQKMLPFSIAEQLRLEGIPGGSPVQTLCSKCGYLEYLAQGHAQLGSSDGVLTYFLGYWRQYSYSHGKINVLPFVGFFFLPIVSIDLLYFSFTPFKYQTSLHWKNRVISAGRINQPQLCICLSAEVVELQL